MTATSGIGYGLIAFGPGFSLFFFAIASKPFLLLTLLTSTIAWLVSFVAIAAVWKAFLPVDGWAHVLLLFTSTSVQEILRVYFWRGFKKVEGFLNGLAAKASKPPISFMEKTQIALGIGFGHGLAHAVLFCLSLLTPASGPGTFYHPSCPNMPFFLIISLMSLGFFVIHTFSMVIAFKGYERNDKKLQVFVPLLHYVASISTLVDLVQGGCFIGIPLVMICAGLTLCVCGRVMWHKTE